MRDEGAYVGPSLLDDPMQPVYVVLLPSFMGLKCRNHHKICVLAGQGKPNNLEVTLFFSFSIPAGIPITSTSHLKNVRVQEGGEAHL